MAAVGVPGHGSVQPEAYACGLGSVGDVSYVHRVQHVVTAIEDLGALIFGHQQRAQGGHRAVVQIGTAQPDAVDGHARVAVSLAVSREHERRGGEGVEAIHQALAKRAQAIRIGANLRDVLHLSHACAAEGVAAGASGLVDGGAAPGLHPIDG